MKLFLCLLPLIVQARITIDLHASKTTSDSSISIKGLSVNTITPNEQTIFGLNETVVKNAIFNLTGRAPTNAYLKGPTLWNDLYTTYNWKPVTTIIKPMKIRVIDTEIANAVLSVKHAVNDGPKPKVEKVTLSAKVEDKVSSFWRPNPQAFTARIDYNINLEGLGNVSRFNLISAWGTELSEINIGTVSPSSVEVPLQPNQNATAILSATKVTVQVEVEYAAILDGNVATNNEVRFKGHHFWAYDIMRVMEAVGLPAKVTASEVIVIEFYDDPKITVEDKYVPNV